MTDAQWRQDTTDKLNAIDEHVTNIRIQMAVFKSKSKMWSSISGGIWGLFAGLIPSIVLFLATR